MMAKQLKIGALVRVRDWEGKLLQRRVVTVCGNLLFVCTDEELREAGKEGRDPITVGWPLDEAGL
jgi:hypothetical protein